MLWFVGYLVLLRVFVPRMRDRSKEMSEARSMLTGRIVDSYTNILTVKLFARARDEDAYVRDAIDAAHRRASIARCGSTRCSRLRSRRSTPCWSPAPARIAIVAVARKGVIEVGTVAMALPLAWQIVNSRGLGRVADHRIFENIGVVQEGMMTIARPISSPIAPDAPALAVTRGEIAFEDVQLRLRPRAGDRRRRQRRRSP